jgi:hypothetical protein
MTSFASEAANSHKGRAATAWARREPRAHDAPVAEGRCHAVDHDAPAAPAGDLNLRSKVAASPNVLNGNSRCALLAFIGRAPYRSAARIPVPVRVLLRPRQSARVQSCRAAVLATGLPVARLSQGYPYFRLPELTQGCPLSSLKRTSVTPLAMSQKCHKRTSLIAERECAACGTVELTS